MRPSICIPKCAVSFAIENQYIFNRWENTFFFSMLKNSINEGKWIRIHGTIKQIDALYNLLNKVSIGRMGRYGKI